MSFALQHDIGEFIQGGFARIPAVITAGAGDDGVEVNGSWFTRVLTALYHSMDVMIVWSTTLVTAETLTLVANIQDADTVGGSGAADYGTALASVVVATATASPNETIVGVTGFHVDLGAAKQFIRLQSTATLSASGTDTVAIAAIFVFGGADVLPAASPY